MFLKQHPYELPFKMECFDNFLHFSLILHHIMFLEHIIRKQVVKSFIRFRICISCANYRSLRNLHEYEFCQH